ncbi:hypothetical protein [Amycolatopsis pithecellobii]|uniref:Uncharacterized protein n=1 Tax=Amycolatopsis pithecellobii TaxID=664692 RepID=A0A6N7YP22_9PSEU|nr:hypothetical protein [Amycolatopsis pithecellobii]MTD54757.1 hypothetical protein [Amycolatopsis pithecellobii]
MRPIAVEMLESLISSGSADFAYAFPARPLVDDRADKGLPGELIESATRTQVMTRSAGSSPPHSGRIPDAIEDGPALLARTESFELAGEIERKPWPRLPVGRSAPKHHLPGGL